MKTTTHFLKNVFHCWRGFQGFFDYKFICNVIFLSQIFIKKKFPVYEAITLRLHTAHSYFFQK